MNRTSIEWCRTYAEDGSYTDGYSVNPVRFRPYADFGSLTLRAVTMCQKVSPGCKNCYAEGIAQRFWPKDGTVRFPGYTAAGLQAGEFELDQAKLLAVLKHRKPCRIFWGDMTDLFGDWVKDEWLDRILAVCSLTPHITHIFLTKRAERMYEHLSAVDIRERLVSEIQRMVQREAWHDNDPRIRQAHHVMARWPLPNVHLGVSAEDQGTYDARVVYLLQVPATVRFVSAEPLLGPINLQPWLSAFKGAGGRGIDWVICGGESGCGARPMHPDWARLLRDQCVAADMPFFFKQWGEFAPGAQGARYGNSKMAIRIDQMGRDVTSLPNKWNATDALFYRIGKKDAGNRLDGRQWHQFSEVCTCVKDRF